MDLINFRVMRSDNKRHYMEKAMTSDEIIARRAELRQILRNSRYNTMSNEQLDRIRLMEGDNGYILEDEKGYEASICTVITGKEAENRRIAAMIPKKYINMRGSSFSWSIYKCNTEAQKKLVNAFVEGFKSFKSEGMGLYIYSKIKGSGKTMLSCCILNELAVRYRENIKFIPILDFMELTKKSFNGQTEELDGIYRCGVLVFDDIGVQTSKEWTETILYRIINDRHNKGLITLYTSNLPPDKLNMDERTIDRIKGTTHIVNMPEVPVRQIETDAKKKGMLKRVYEEMENKERGQYEKS